MHVNMTFTIITELFYIIVYIVYYCYSEHSFQTW